MVPVSVRYDGGSIVSHDLDKQLEGLRARFLNGELSRRDLFKAAAAAAAGATVAAAAARVGPNVASAQSGDEQIFFHDARWQDPVTFDFNANLYCNAEPEAFAGLLQFDANLLPVADWAETYEANGDATVYTFHIRKDNKGWSDGTPVTAGDFVYSFARQLDPATVAPYASFLFDIKYGEAFNTQTAVTAAGDPLEGKVPTAADLGLKAIDDWTLEVTMEGPRGVFPVKVAYTAAVPAPKWKVEELGDAWALGGDNPIVTNGPFKVESWEHDQTIRLVKNEGYWDAENVKLATVVEPIHPSANSVLMYETGTGDQRLDWTVLAAADYKKYLDDATLSAQLNPYVYPGIWMMLPSNGQPPFDKLEVRQALSHAIDRDRLVTVTNGLVSPAFCMVPAGVFGYLDDPKFGTIQDFNKEKALQALVGTEFEGGKNWPEITMWMRAQEENYNADLMANDIVAQLKENLGMDVKIQMVPQSNFSQQLYENTWQLVFIRWWYDYPDPDNGYGDMFYSRKASGKRQAWSNTEFDDLVIKGREEPDPAKRLEIYAQCETVIQNDVGYMPVVYRLDQNVFKPWVKGVPVNQQGYLVPDGNIFVGSLRTIFIEGREGS
jgi:ABC-type oligopeptide transport system substrate-binding subunit